MIIGDAVHNLHTALDMAIWDIIPPDHNLKFPFYQTRKELEGQMTKGKIFAHAPEIAHGIINDIKPWRGGNDSFYGLHSLDIMDKHKLLIPVIDRIELVGVDAKIGTGTFTNLNFFIDNLTELNAISSPGEVKITNYGRASFQILFCTRTTLRKSTCYTNTS